MFSLLDPRLWGAIGLAVALSFAAGFWKGNQHGKAAVRAEWLESRRAADQESRRLEQARQRRADEAAKLAAAREARIRVDAGRARDAVGILRGTLDSVERRASESRAAADNAVRALSNVVGECSGALVEVAEDADRARSEVKTLRDAWPK